MLGCRPALPLLALILAACTSACQTSGNYLQHRALDLTDVIDFKYGSGQRSLGLGAKLELTQFIGVGAGVGRYDQVTETFGRYRRSGPSRFFHVGVFGYDGPDGGPETLPDSEVYSVGFNTGQERWPPWIARFRVGPELLLLNATGGLYLNLGELLDLLTGIVLLDPAGDDGLAPGSAW